MPQAWRHVDQPPVFLRAFSAGDEVLSLSGEFVTTFGVFGAGPTAASDFILDLVDALCERGVSIDVDLVSRSGMRTHELQALIDELEPTGGATQVGDGHWLVSLECGARLREWVGLLVGSNLDYQFDFAGVRFAERDASIVVIAGSAAAISDVQALLDDVALHTETDLKPLGWDLDVD